MLDGWIDDSTANPRESTITLSRRFFTGTTGAGATANSEFVEFFNNKYAGYPYGGGKRFGINVGSSGTTARYRDFGINFYDPTESIATRETPIMNITPTVQSGNTKKVDYANIEFENANVIMGNDHYIELHSNTGTLTFSNSTDINTTTNVITVSSTTNLWTGQRVIISGASTEPESNTDNRNTADVDDGTGTISTTYNSTTVTGSGTLLHPSL